MLNITYGLIELILYRPFVPCLQDGSKRYHDGSGPHDLAERCVIASIGITETAESMRSLGELRGDLLFLTYSVLFATLVLQSVADQAMLWISTTRIRQGISVGLGLLDVLPQLCSATYHFQPLWMVSACDPAYQFSA